MSGDEYTPTQSFRKLIEGPSVLVLIENIPPLWEEKQLLEYFGQRAKILEANVERDPATDWSLGKASIRFHSLDEALKVINDINGKEILKGASNFVKLSISDDECKRLNLEESPSKENCKIILDSIAKNITESEINDICRNYGRVETIECQPISEVAKLCTVSYVTPEEAGSARENLHVIQEQLNSLKPRPNDRAPSLFTGANPSYAYEMPYNEYPSSQPPLQKIFIEYYTVEGMVYYYNAYTKATQWERPPPDCYIIFTPTQRPEPRSAPNYPSMTMSPHSSEQRPSRASHGGRRGPPGCNVFIFHLPNDWSEQDLHKHFSKFGNLISTRVMMDKITGRNKGYGFASYDNPQAAQKAVAEMNGYSILGKRLKVELKKGDDDAPHPQNNLRSY